MTTTDRSAETRPRRRTPDRNHPSTCTVDGCERAYVARGLCTMHYSRQYRGRPIGSHEMQRDASTVCSVAECGSPARMWGYCTLHGQRYRAHGDPEALGWGTLGDETETALYRLRDGDGSLLYVGVTMDIKRRFHQHRKSQPWWAEVADYEVQILSTRSSALMAERKAIQSEKPQYNRLLSAKSPD